MNWKDRYDNKKILPPGTKIKPTCIIDGNEDEIDWKIGNIYTIGKFDEFNINENCNSYYLIGMDVVIFQTEFVVVK